MKRVILQLGPGLIIAAALLGCPSSPPQAVKSSGPSGGQSPRDAPDAAAAADGAWRPAPVSIRIYPSTRFVEEDGVPILEARIELFDAMGDSIKSSGAMRCELFALGEGERPAVGRRLYRWDIEIKTLDEQRRYFDPIIRGYVFRLKMDDLELVRRPTLLRVVFQPPDAPRLKTEGRVRTDW